MSPTHVIIKQLDRVCHQIYDFLVFYDTPLLVPVIEDDLQDASKCPIEQKSLCHKVRRRLSRLCEWVVMSAHCPCEALSEWPPELELRDFIVGIPC